MVCGEAVALPLQVSRLPQTRVLAHSWPDMAPGYGDATGPDGLGEMGGQTLHGLADQVNEIRLGLVGLR
jgi:hypothetical protein